MCYCGACRDNLVCEGSNDEEFCGQASATDTVGMHEEAERLGIFEVITFYHYFFNSPGKARMIAESEVVASRVKCICTACITRSLDTSEPHYGDGAYGTANGNLSPKDEEPVSILRAHGFNNLKERTHRAVLRLDNPDAFRKFSNTGGVIRSHPDKTERLSRNELCYHRIEDAHIIRIDTWSETRGEWVPVGKGDLDGF